MRAADVTQPIQRTDLTQMKTYLLEDKSDSSVVLAISQLLLKRVRVRLSPRSALRYVTEPTKKVLACVCVRVRTHVRTCAYSCIGINNSADACGVSLRYTTLYFVCREATRIGERDVRRAVLTDSSENLEHRDEHTSEYYPCNCPWQSRRRPAKSDFADRLLRIGFREAEHVRCTRALDAFRDVLGRPLCTILCVDLFEKSFPHVHAYVHA